MKTVKMLGFQHHLTGRIQELREEELHAASKLRWMTVGYNASGSLLPLLSSLQTNLASANALGIFSPAITIAIFAGISRFRGHTLDAQTAFTTMAILSMVTHPANMIMTFVPRAIASLAGFDRIQAFLLRPSLQAFRSTLPDSYQEKATQRSSGRTAIVIEDLKIGNIFGNINITMPANSLNIVSGPTGSGKSTLLRAILGEVVPSSGSVGVSTKQIGYCAQKPWLPAGTIKDVIHGTTKHDGSNNSWYDAVVGACCLKADIAALPEGNGAQVGSRGCNLSGGQRQRVVSISLLVTMTGSG
jgi:ABC-type multidrug transport system fused ATPase/permease subunit